MNQPLADAGDLAYLASSIIPLNWLFTVGRLRGRLNYRFAHGSRTMVQDNLATAFGDVYGRPELEAMTRRFLENQQVMRLAVMLAPRMSDADLARLVRIEGLHHLELAIAEKKGVILLVSHLYSAFTLLVFVYLRRRGYDVRVAMPTSEDAWVRTRFRQRLDRWTGRPALREMLGAFYVQFNVRPIVRALKEGAVVAQTGDGWHSASFVEVDFLGRKVPFTSGMMRVAQMTGALIVPMWTIGEPPDGTRFVVDAPFAVGPERSDVEQAVRAYAARLERYVRDDPPAWQHWEFPDTLRAMTALTEQSLSERYMVGGGHHH